MIKKIFILCLLLIATVSLVHAQPDNNFFSGGITLETLTYEYHPLDTDYYLHTHVYETERGVALDPNTINCSYHLYSEASNWNHIDTGVLDPSPFGAGLSTTINASVFNETGDYNFLLWCEEPLAQPSKAGGFIKYYFTVYEDEKSPTNYFEIIGLLAIVLLLVVAFVTGINVLGVITSIGIIIYGLTFMLSSILIGTLVLAGGLLLALYFATKQSD